MLLLTCDQVADVVSAGESYMLELPHSKTKTPSLRKRKQLRDKFELFRHENPELCPIEAIVRQLQLVRDIPMKDRNFLFRKCSPRHNGLSDMQATTSALDKCSDWVSSVLNVRFRWKGIARAAGVSRILEGGEVSRDELARYLGIDPLNLSHYDRGNSDNTRAKVARALVGRSGLIHFN